MAAKSWKDVVVVVVGVARMVMGFPEEVVVDTAVGMVDMGT